MKKQKKQSETYPVNLLRTDGKYLDRLRDKKGYRSKAIVVNKLIKVIKLHKMEEEI